MTFYVNLNISDGVPRNQPGVKNKRTWLSALSLPLSVLEISKLEFQILEVFPEEYL